MYNIRDSSKSGLDLPKDGVLFQKSVWMKYKVHTCVHSGGRICVPRSELSRVFLCLMPFNGRTYFRPILVDRTNDLVLIGYRLKVCGLYYGCGCAYQRKETNNCSVCQICKGHPTQTIPKICNCVMKSEFRP